MRIIYGIFSILVVLFSVVSCKKNDIVIPVTATKTELLTGKEWKLSSLTLEIPYVTPIGTFQDIYAILIQDCDKDNTFLFNKDLSAFMYEKATKCDPVSRDTVQGTWKFLENETKLHLTIDTHLPVDTFIIQSLSATEFKFKLDVTHLSIFAGDTTKRIASGSFQKQ